MMATALAHADDVRPANPGPIGALDKLRSLLNAAAIGDTGGLELHLTRAGYLTMSGHLPTRYAIQRAIQIALTVDGIISVRNEVYPGPVRLVPGTSADPQPGNHGDSAAAGRRAAAHTQDNISENCIG